MVEGTKCQKESKAQIQELITEKERKREENDTKNKKERKSLKVRHRESTANQTAKEHVPKTYAKSDKITPFEAVYGIPPPSLLSYVAGTSRVQAVDEYLRDRDSILRELHRNLLIARNRMKCQADQNRREVTYEVGDYVYLKLHPYWQSSVEFRSSMKLAPRYFGPYEVLEKVGPVAYKLALPNGSQIHNVFHVSLLRKHIGHVVHPVSVTLPSVINEDMILPQPEAVIDHRVIHKGKYRLKSEVLVKWKGARTKDATWENEWRFRKSYPDFILPDKDSKEEGLMCEEYVK
ncbi:transposon ty3-G gag-pol polyprotein [Tanacetum coccineum]